MVLLFIQQSAIYLPQCFAEVAELVDALDSKSSMAYPMWGFDSPLRHMVYVYVLKSLKDFMLYIGLTDDIPKRITRQEETSP